MALSTANEYCANMGKEILVKNEANERLNYAGRASEDLTFQCLRKDDPQLQRPRYEKVPDTVIEERHN
jgi:hypothetical protein